MLAEHPFLIRSFINLSGRNLCFSNEVVSVLLTITILINELLLKESNIFEGKEWQIQ